MPVELSAEQIESLFAKLLRAHAADIEAFKQDRWFERAAFRRALRKKPSWIDPLHRWFFDRAMAEARRIGTTTSKGECVVIPVWLCTAYEEAESRHRLHHLYYYGPNDFDLTESRKAVVVHATVTRFIAPYIAASRGYASTIALPRFGPYAVVRSCCGGELGSVFEAVAVEPTPSPRETVPPFCARLTLAIPLSEVPQAFREPLTALIRGYNGSTDLG